MLHGWHSNSGIHGYLDREGRGGKVAIHGCSMDDTVTLSICRQRRPGWVLIHGWSIDGQSEWPLMDGEWISLVRQLATLLVILRHLWMIWDCPWQHLTTLQTLGYPTDVKGFLSYCGAAKTAGISLLFRFEDYGLYPAKRDSKISCP